MTAKKVEVGGLDYLGVDLTNEGPSRPPVEHTYEAGGLDLLGSDMFEDLGSDDLQAKKQQALRGLELLGTGKPVDWARLKDAVFKGVRLTSAVAEILSDPDDHPSEIRTLLRRLVELIDLIDTRK